MMTQNALKVLDCMIDLLSVPERWTQHALAKDKQGGTVSPNSRHAVSWCVMGASDHCLATTLWPVRREVHDALRDAALELSPSTNGYIAKYNDHPRRGHASIMKLLRLAREKAADAG